MLCKTFCVFFVTPGLFVLPMANLNFDILFSFFGGHLAEI